MTDCSTYIASDKDWHWKKPTEVIKLRKKKRLSTLDKKSKENSATSLAVKEAPPLTKPNPFRTKRSEIKSLEKGIKESVLYQEVLLKVKTEQREPLCGIENTMVKNVLLPGKEEINPGSDSFPTDWSLKLKARFTSVHPFSWGSVMSSIEEASGITNFTRCSADENLKIKTPDQHLSTLQQCLMQWIHPDTAWNITSLNETILSTMHHQWSTSFNSLYHLYQAGICPYFYVVAQNFVVLFLLKGFAGTEVNTVYISPTTTGLRKAMKIEGITFSMPLAETKPKHEQQDGDIADKSELNTSTSDDEDNALWMASVGVRQEQAIIISGNDGSHLDYRPSSLVKIEGNQIHPFFNFLLNYQLGNTSGMPATLLSPVAFKGAILSSLKSQLGKAKQYKSKRNYTEIHYLEITGSIMPQQLTQLCRLMAETQNGHFSVTLSTMAPTVAFNFPVHEQVDCEETNNEVTSMAGLSDIDIRHFSSPSALNKQAIQRLHCHHHKYNWEA
ncbi:protein downstream neighbor of son homolog isoform X2 [Dysidea avara]|uniref:protein downstream neighbor of son homolog isoform X2 n=1 Tax=Dysidea avara TaxID=196820 RepID=UPI00331E3A14